MAFVISALPDNVSISPSFTGAASFKSRSTTSNATFIGTGFDSSGDIWTTHPTELNADTHERPMRCNRSCVRALNVVRGRSPGVALVKAGNTRVIGPNSGNGAPCDVRTHNRARTCGEWF